MPQLNPEFFASQLFWLVITFVFLFIFLWRISLPRINIVQTKRENKIKEDIKKAKQLQAEAEDIQEQINKQLDQAKSDSAELIKSAFIKLQDESSKKLEELDKNLSTKIDATYEEIEKNKSESMSQIYEQINDITKLMISKISNVQVNEGEIKMAVEKIRQKVIH
jgi:F-type H+-transporting ATPase subunit b